MTQKIADAANALRICRNGLSPDHWDSVYSPTKCGRYGWVMLSIGQFPICCNGIRAWPHATKHFLSRDRKLRIHAHATSCRWVPWPFKVAIQLTRRISHRPICATRWLKSPGRTGRNSSVIYCCSNAGLRRKFVRKRLYRSRHGRPQDTDR